MVEVVDVVEVEGCYEASKSFLISDGQNTSPSGVVVPLVCLPSPSWPTLMIKSSATLGLVDIAVVVEVDVQTLVVSGPLEAKW